MIYYYCNLYCKITTICDSHVFISCETLCVSQQYRCQKTFNEEHFLQIFSLQLMSCQESREKERFSWWNPRFVTVPKKCRPCLSGFTRFHNLWYDSYRCYSVYSNTPMKNSWFAKQIWRSLFRGPLTGSMNWPSTKYTTSRSDCSSCFEQARQAQRHTGRIIFGSFSRAAAKMSARCLSYF